MPGHAKGFIRKQVADMIGMPARRIQFYTDEKLVTPEIENPKGRGTTRIYSELNVLELLIIQELTGAGFGLERTKEILFHVSYWLRGPEADFWRLWDKETNIGGFLTIYTPADSDGYLLGALSRRDQNDNRVVLMMDRYKSAFVIDIDKLARGVLK